LVYFWLHVHFLWKRHVGRAEIRNSIQQSTRWGAWAQKKAFFIKLFQQIQIFGKHIISREIIRNAKS